MTLGSGETLFFGRSPDRAVPEESPENALRITAIALPRCAPHVSRVLGELIVGEEIARLRWHGSGETQVSSLFDAPGGARRVTVTEGMSLLLDEGENQLVVMRGRLAGDTYDDLSVSIEVTPSGSGPVVAMPRPDADDADDGATAPAPMLPRQSREWYVALALAEPWLSGTDDYPRPPSNREIYERILHWHGYAWNLERAQRVDDAIRSISALAFGPKDDPFRAGSGRAQNVRFAIGRRTAEIRLVTTEDLDEAERAAARRNVPPPRA
ncbi:hypothetical protein GCM10027215_01440 [Nocardioides zeae]